MSASFASPLIFNYFDNEPTDGCNKKSCIRTENKSGSPLDMAQKPEEYDRKPDEDDLSKQGNLSFSPIITCSTTNSVIGTLSKKRRCRERGGQQEDFHSNRIEAD